jgi:hypothetical protein
MEGSKSCRGVAPEVVSAISNKWLTATAGTVKEIVVSPIAIVKGAVIPVIIAIVIHWAAWGAWAGACRQGDENRSYENCFK